MVFRKNTDTNQNISKQKKIQQGGKLLEIKQKNPNRYKYIKYLNKYHNYMEKCNEGDVLSNKLFRVALTISKNKNHEKYLTNIENILNNGDVDSMRNELNQWSNYITI